jgi:shikimate dehydrogenase
MHNAAARALALDMVYVPLPVPPPRLADAVRGLSALGFAGANVTVPHKEAVLPLLDDVAAAARAVGAVNTITVNRDAKGRETSLNGDNTDVGGFMGDLEAHGVPVSGRDCLVLGAGGAARAVVYGLARGGATVQVCARRRQQAVDLVTALQPHLGGQRPGAHAWETLPTLSAQLAAPLIVNTTPVGMHGGANASPWPSEIPLPAGAFVYDLIYNPRETALMRQARAAGCATANGLGMLLRQGALSFAIWTGQEPALDVMAAALPE